MYADALPPPASAGDEATWLLFSYSFNNRFQLLQDNPSEIEGKRIANLLCSVPLTNFAVILLTLLLLALPFFLLPFLPSFLFLQDPFQREVYCEEVVQWITPLCYSLNVSNQVVRCLHC